MLTQELINDLITQDQHEQAMRKRYDNTIALLNDITKTYGGLHQIILSEEFESLEQSLWRMTENHEHVDSLDS